MDDKRTCCGGWQNGNYSCAVKLFRSEIKYDILELLYQVGLAELQEPEEDYISRKVTSALNTACQRVRWCVDHRKSRLQSDEIQDVPDTWVLSFLFPLTWKGKPENMMNNLHDYVVNKISADYMKSKGNDAWSTYELDANTFLYYFESECNAFGHVKASFKL